MTTTMSNQEVIAERVYWRGALRQSMSMELGGKLLNTLNDCDSLIVNLEGVEFLDFSCLVLLCAVKRHANEKGKFLAIEGLENPAVLPSIQRFREKGNRLCRAYCGNSCLYD